MGGDEDGNYDGWNGSGIPPHSPFNRHNWDQFTETILEAQYDVILKVLLIPIIQALADLQRYYSRKGWESRYEYETDKAGVLNAFKLSLCAFNSDMYGNSYSERVVIEFSMRGNNIFATFIKNRRGFAMYGSEYTCFTIDRKPHTFKPAIYNKVKMLVG